MSNALIETGPTITERRPRFEGSNICTWIGFKHVMYLVEEAILEHFRRCGMPARRLYEEQGLCLEIVDSGVRILHALHMDDSVRIEVTPKTTAGAGELTFGVRMFVTRDGSEVKSLTGKVKVLLRQDRCGITVTPSANGLSPYVVSKIERGGAAGDGSHADPDRGVESADELIRQVAPPMPTRSYGSGTCRTSTATSPNACSTPVICALWRRWWTSSWPIAESRFGKCWRAAAGFR